MSAVASNPNLPSHSLANQIAEIEASLTRMQQRIGDVPVTEILISRMLINLGREMTQRLDTRLRPSGLMESEFRALVSLYSLPGSTGNPSDLCTDAGQSPANITRITDALAERELILRRPDEHDRRRWVLQVTPKGTALIKKMLPNMMNGARESYSEFSSAELKRLLTSLKTIAATIDRNSSDKAAASKQGS